MSSNFMKLGQVATFINGKAFKPNEWTQSGIPIIRIQNLTNNTKEFNYYQGKLEPRYVVKNGDILISWSASLGVFEWDGPDAALNQHIFKVQFNKLDVDKTYFKFIVSQVINEMLRFVHGSTMKHIVKNDFDNTKIPLPKLSEQQRIATIIDHADSIRRKNRQILEKYNELAQSVFYEMFGDPDRNPHGLPIVRFDSIGKIDRGVSKHRPRNAPELLGGNHPLIQTGDVANSQLFITKFDHTYSDLGLAQSKLWPKGTLCITIAANIGKTGILGFDACFPDSVVGFVPNNTSDVIYIHFWLSCIQKRLEDSAP